MGGVFGWTPHAVAALVIAGSATGIAAQEFEPAPIEEIEALEAEAERHLEDLDGWDRAASLYRKAATLRPQTDPSGIQNLLVAARLAYYDGNERQAIRDFESAGHRALAIGDVVAAANAFTDAAWIAGTTGQPSRALALLGRAELLSHSPVMPELDRELLKMRLEVTGA